MPDRKSTGSDDTASAPESGTPRDDTSGNLPSNPDHRPAPSRVTPATAKHPKDSTNANKNHRAPDDTSVAGEER